MSDLDLPQIKKRRAQSETMTRCEVLTDQSHLQETSIDELQLIDPDQYRNPEIND